MRRGLTNHSFLKRNLRENWAFKTKGMNATFGDSLIYLWMGSNGDGESQKMTHEASSPLE